MKSSSCCSYLLLLVVGLLFLAPMCIDRAAAQAPPPSLGNVANVSLYEGGVCPVGFVNPNMTCYQATIQHCGGADDMQLIFGFAGTANSNGLIVFFNGEGGTSPDGINSQDADFALYYLENGYSVVQTKWLSDWEYTTDPKHPDQSFNIQNAACRPASFLYWARTNTTVTPVMFPTNPRAGMCAQGFSAGSAAITYDLAWYNGGAPTSQGGAALDKVILNVGPPLTNIDAGCVDNPNVNNISICTDPKNQPYCSGWGNGIKQSDAYVNGTQTWVQNWTGQPSCQTGNYNGTVEDLWQDQSIINTDPADPQPNLSWASTEVSAYLCETFSSGAANENNAQGFELLSQKGLLTSHLTINAVQLCVGPEGFTGTGATVVVQGQQQPQPTASVVETDMLTGVNGTGKCTRSPGH